MEASPFHHHHLHHSFLDQYLLYPNPTTTSASGTASTGFSDEFQQPLDQIIPNGFVESSLLSNQVSIGSNLQSSDSPSSMVVHDHSFEGTMPTTSSYGMRKKSCRKRSQNKSNTDQENNKKIRDFKEGQIGYVYVRARRGQATDSHSLAERVRRDKISEKMKTLQAIVPGCDKITGKALMLDQVISYVQSLQNEIQLLSSKLACVDPMYDFRADFDASVFRSHQNMTTDQQQLLSSQEFQMSNMVFENIEDVWDLGEKRQELEDPFAIINNFSSFY